MRIIRKCNDLLLEVSPFEAVVIEDALRFYVDNSLEHTPFDKMAGRMQRQISTLLGNSGVLNGIDIEGWFKKTKGGKNGNNKERR